MTVFLSFSLVLLFAVSVGVLIYLKQQRQVINAALARLDTIKGSDSDDTSEPYMVLTVRVLDPIGLAKRESRSARVVADHMPAMVSKRVYQQVMKELGEELNARGIDAEMAVEYR
ncbi:hypothetical protein ACTXGQ_08725 [Marinobacter sp. 1Y8]